MTLPLLPTSTSYRIRFDTLPHPVKVTWQGHVVAVSHRAKVMYETRLPAVIYIPLEDIRADLSDLTPLQTFCPFKGTAVYRDLKVAGTTLSNAVWSYEDALPESDEVKGYAAFQRVEGMEFDLGANTLHETQDGNINGPLIDWLLREAATLPDPESFTKALSDKLRAHGVALSRMSVMIWSLHPLIVGKNYVWAHDTGDVSTYAPSYEIHDHPAFVNSPLRHVSQGLGGVRQKLDRDYGENSFPILEDLRAKGATDYVAMPLPFSDGRINVLAVSSDHPDGFTTANLGLIFECSAVISRFYEVFMQRENAQSLLETYLGKRTGARVLGGEIRRGDGDEIDAAILFCDLRASTRLAGELDRASYIALLNQFFEVTSTLVQEHGGEVLKFIGDAVLAVFPAGQDAQAACEQAVAAARDVVDRLALPADEGAQTCAIGIAFGRVTYGNVGSRDRLDFTVIGQAANIAARLCDFAKTSGYGVVATQEVAQSAPDSTDLGPVVLRNVPDPVPVFGVGEPVL